MNVYSSYISNKNVKCGTQLSELHMWTCVNYGAFWDFNVVRKIKEMRQRNKGECNSREIRAFNKFNDKLGVYDISLVGTKYM